MSTKLMLRFGIASIVLAIIGALLSFFTGPDASKQHTAARTHVTPPVKKVLAQRRSQRAWIVLGERVGDTGLATREAALKAALISPQRPAVASAPAPQILSVQPTPQIAPIPPQAPATEPQPYQAANIDYLPPSMVQKGKPADTTEQVAAKPKSKAKSAARSNGTGVIYHTQQTSGRDRRAHRQRGGNGGFVPWGW